MFVSCSKTGPTGPAGATGAAGSNGANGAIGATGPDSVQYSPWITVQMESSLDIYGNAIFIDTIQASAVTSAIINQGAVLGYLYSPTLLAAGDSTISSVDNAFINFLAELPKPGMIILYSSNDYSGYQYRYVLVPGKISVSSSSGQVNSYTPAQLRTMNYSTLSGALSIPAKGNSLKANSN